MATTDSPTPGDADSVVRSTRLPGGDRVVVRAAGPGDVDALVELFERLDPQDRHRRFFSMFHPDRAFVEHMVDLPERGGLLLVAEVRPADPHDAPRLVGEAGYSMRDDGDASLDITVDSGARGWLAPYLLDALVEQAGARGISNLHAEILLGNRPMLALVRARGSATVDSEDRSVVETTMGTCADTPSWPPLGDRPRVLVEVPGARWRATPELEADGIDVIACGGPGSRKAHPCPMLEGRTCPLVDGADVVVFSLRESDDQAHRLLEAHQQMGTRPLVIELRRGERPVDLPDDALTLETPTIDEIRDAVEALLGPPAEGTELNPWVAG